LTFFLGGLVIGSVGLKVRLVEDLLSVSSIESLDLTAVFGRFLSLLLGPNVERVWLLTADLVGMDAAVTSVDTDGKGAGVAS
jgi:hypothetical protein